MRPRLVIVSVVLAVVMLLSWTVPAKAIDLGDALKVFGIGFAVRQFGGQINSFINTLLAQRGVEWEDTTKVVPIISIGRGAYIGAAQVAGPPSQVGQVEAVAQGEISLGSGRVNALIPVSSLNVTRLDRVEGVGLSALIDFRI